MCTHLGLVLTAGSGMIWWTCDRCSNSIWPLSVLRQLNIFMSISGHFNFDFLLVISIAVLPCTMCGFFFLFFLRGVRYKVRDFFFFSLLHKIIFKKNLIIFWARSGVLGVGAC